MRKAADILGTILGEQEARLAGEWSTFFKGWRALAGDDIAAHSRVRDVKQGVVIVEVDHPGWLQMLQMKKGKILECMKKRYPELEIRDIHIFLGAGASGGGAAGAAANGGDGMLTGAARQAGKPDTTRGEGRAGPDGSRNNRTAGTPEAEKPPENTETTKEYKDFKKMLGRLRKGKM